MKHKQVPKPAAPRQRGVSLIEVLVSVLVVSLGRLGAGALQATALRNNQGSYERTPVEANLATRDLARWINSMHTQIHAGACGAVDCNGSVCTVQVQWDDSRASGGLAAQNISLTAQL